MTEGKASSPFSARGTLLLILFGAVVFVTMLWMIGAGMSGGSTNDGQAHVSGKGLNGYAALADYLERRGTAVNRARNEGALDDPGLLVITPTQSSPGDDLERIVSARRTIGPTMVILPKWITAHLSSPAGGAKKGWVELISAAPPDWPGFYDDITIVIEPEKNAQNATWSAGNVTGKLPAPRSVLSGQGDHLVPLVVSAPRNRVLAAYVADGGHYPRLDAIAAGAADFVPDEEYDHIFPVIMVFEPDLLNNYGMARRESAVLADRLFGAARANAGGPVTFDLTLNGHGRSTNLLTMSFTPPFLAATLCLLMAALVVGWRAFLRFGPPARTARAIAFGKRQLVSNAAGLIRRARRYHLVSLPYIARSRRRLVTLLGLPRLASTAQTDEAIDRAMASRAPDVPPFSALAARLASQRRAHDVLIAARELHDLERKLTR